MGTKAKNTKSLSTAVFGVLFGVLLLAASAAARAEMAITAKAGTLGGGVELTVGLSPQVNVRLGGNAFDYTDNDREVSGIFYDATAHLRTAEALLDFHPGGRSFRLSAGAIYNDTKVDGSSLPPASGSYDIGGVAVPVSIVGTLDGKIDFNPVVPYVGIGWGNAVGPGRRVRFAADLGVVFQGKGNVTLTPLLPADSPLNTNPVARQAFQILIDREERDIEQDVADYTAYPVISVGVSYRF
ncbi:MAG: hypothetical protein QOF89_2856 [Acidobacteriota bacterium]|jgi:hypothetical protein|nr:hypothetical protein [Acidobacteriota bacterium]